MQASPFRPAYNISLVEKFSFCGSWGSKSLVESLEEITRSCSEPVGRLGKCQVYDLNRVLRRDQVVGHNCRFMQGPGTDQNELARLRSAIKDERPMTVSSLLEWKQPFVACSETKRL